ncbi:MAG TPA: OsmC family protein [Thermomicrobiales bacterium]|nr:OsmC family protein [Thermomicrobiales bacterium]HRA47749.1 OsmC family protein [Thermomicrobiales bacterium]
MSDLDTYLARKRDLMTAVRAAAPTDPGARKQKLEAQVIAEGSSGIRRIKIRDFQIITDTGPAIGGFDLGPRAPEVLLGALGSCISHTILIQAALQQIPIDSLVIDLAGEIDSLAGHSDIPGAVSDLHYTVTVQSAASAEQITALTSLLGTVCPVLNVVEHPQNVRATVLLNGKPIA